MVVFKPFAQVVQVIDPLEYMPIADVVITDAKCTRQKTNMLGEALIEAFSAKDSLIFEHPYYNTKKIAFKTIKKDGFKVFLLDKSFIVEVEVDDGLKRDAITQHQCADQNSFTSGHSENKCPNYS